jgi:hypothetical protein
MKIVSYRVFDTPKEFESWQLENDDLKIISIFPIVNGMDGNQYQKTKDSPEEFEFNTYTSVFVTFWKEV